MNGDEITSDKLRAVGMAGDDACGYYPPDLKGNLLVELRDEPNGGEVWGVTAHTKDLSLVYTVRSMDQVKAACMMAGLTMPASKTEMRNGGDGLPTEPIEFEIVRVHLCEWMRRRSGRQFDIDHSFDYIHLRQDGLSTHRLAFNSPSEAERIARDVLVADLTDSKAFLDTLAVVHSAPSQTEFQGILQPLKRGEEATETGGDQVRYGDGSKEADPTSESVATDWLAGGKAAGEVRMVSRSHRSDGSGWLIVSAKPTGVKADGEKLTHIPTFVRRSFFSEDELPYLRSAIRELQQVHNLGYEASPDTGDE